LHFLDTDVGAGIGIGIGGLVGGLVADGTDGGFPFAQSHLEIGFGKEKQQQTD
jgi:hypothetical protein